MNCNTTHYRANSSSVPGDPTDEALRVYPVRSDADVKAQLAEVFGDTQFSYGARGVGRASARYQPKTYRFVFAHGTAGHSDDTSYIFGNEEEATGPADRMISDAMIGYWSRFAATGDPNGAGAPVWPTFDPLADNFLKFGADAITVEKSWRTAKLDFIERYFASRGVATVGPAAPAATR